MRGVLKPNVLPVGHVLSKHIVHTFGVALLAFSVACSRSNNSPTAQQLHDSTVASEVDTNREFQTDEGELRVVSRQVLEDLVRQGRARPGVLPAQDSPDSLLIGLPKSSLGKEHYFGGVITSTTDKENEELGGLKLTDMTPLHVFPRQVTDTAHNTSSLLLEGCVQNCKAGFTERTPVAEFPISGEDSERIYVDFSVIGGDLNLVEIIDPSGEYTHLKGVSSKTVKVSFSNDTLLFDVLGDMEEMPVTPVVANNLVPQGLKAAAPVAKKVSFTTRWYLKKRLVSTNFKPQVATNGIGFFMTERFATSHVLKHPSVDSANLPIKTHYFIKNVPEEHKAAFKQAFEDWNDVFEQEIGARILTTEFIDENDPLAADVVAGDIRIHVVEWDLLNKAGYGGLGPSVGDQETGSILSSNVLVQGPEIIKIYTEWFQVNKEAQALREMGEEARADEVLKEARNTLFEEIKSNSKAPKMVLALNGKLKFNVNSQDPRMQDEVAATKLDFEVLPENVTYEEYMRGYMRELLGHELGHNMGLRHNFRGNLFASNDLEVGKQSGSIMEYLARPYRFKDRISAYDHMAIAYGYDFKTPARRDMFCTDEGVGNLAKHVGSAECSRDDAENNPYAFLTTRFTRTRDLFIGKGSAEAPVWTKEAILPSFTKYSDGILLYGESAERSLSTWIKFFETPGRPEKNAAAVKSYVAKSLANIVCEPGLEDAIKAEKASTEATLALENLNEFRKMTQDRVREVLGSSFANEITCVQVEAVIPAQD